MIDAKLSPDGKQLIITADLETPTLSTSKKTLVVASTYGNLRTGIKLHHDGKDKPVTLSLTAYIPKV
jgi:hypothetical protein